ncbi:MAG: hypothetical protein RR839_05865, partial [Oscillospiraceae bacterium]
TLQDENKFNRNQQNNIVYEEDLSNNSEEIRFDEDTEDNFEFEDGEITENDEPVENEEIKFEVDNSPSDFDSKY